jgi:hypothetical protein
MVMNRDFFMIWGFRRLLVGDLGVFGALRALRVLRFFRFFRALRPY